MFLGVIVALVLLSVGVFLPETSHPGTRGVDKLSDCHDQSNLERSRGRRWLKLKMPVILNPFSSLLMLRSPNVLVVVSLNLTFATFSDLPYCQATVAFLAPAVDYGVSVIINKWLIRISHSHSPSWLPQSS